MKLAWIPAAACVAIAALLMAAAPAQALGRGGVIYSYAAGNGGKYRLDADANTYGTNGRRVQLWDASSRTDTFDLRLDGTIRQGDGKYCLDADVNTINRNGAKVQMWKCNGSRQQQWTVSQKRYATGQGNRTGAIIVNRLSGRCLDADLNTVGRNGTIVQLWDCTGQPQQLWNDMYP